MKILITGAAGFIGYNLANLLLKKIIKFLELIILIIIILQNSKRILLLNKNKKFSFNKIDITKKKLSLYFKKINLI